MISAKITTIVGCDNDCNETHSLRCQEKSLPAEIKLIKIKNTQAPEQSKRCTVALIKIVIANAKSGVGEHNS